MSASEQDVKSENGNGGSRGPGDSIPVGKLTPDPGLPAHVAVPVPLGLDSSRRSQDRGVASGQVPTLHDGQSRRFRLAVAAAGTLGLAGIWLAVACLRDAALHRMPSSFGGGVGYAASSVHLHGRPSYVVLFLLLSYSVVVAGIAFSAGAHDPHAVRLKIARQRVERATEDYDRAFALRVLSPLKVEQPHLDLVGLAGKRLDVIQMRDQKWRGKDDSGASD